VQSRGGPQLQSQHLRISGTQFVARDGRPFDWRGITAFRLVEMVAHGRASEADAYLRWAAAKRLTGVRVLAMAGNLFTLSPADGQRALPTLLEMAERHGLHVEVVALADTAAVHVDADAHVKAIGEICARHANALLEIANEPVHPTQAKAIHDPAYLKSLAALVPSVVPVSLGSVETGEGFASGTYVTWHAPRSGRHGWPAEIEQGAALVQKFAKPVVSDEPIGAADRASPGRRDNVPAHFRESARIARRAGVYATFHYEGGLQAKRPTRTELACLDAWLAGLSDKRGQPPFFAKKGDRRVGRTADPIAPRAAVPDYRLKVKFTVTVSSAARGVSCATTGVKRHCRTAVNAASSSCGTERRTCTSRTPPAVSSRTSAMTTP
jgi:hypothetical protein